MELLVKPEILTSYIYIYNLSCCTVVCKNFASYQAYPNYRWDSIRHAKGKTFLNKRDTSVSILMEVRHVYREIWFDVCLWQEIFLFATTSKRPNDVQCSSHVWKRQRIPFRTWRFIPLIKWLWAAPQDQKWVQWFWNNGRSGDTWGK
jgi:hypothetical protein